jgi:hypothetical protein
MSCEANLGCATTRELLLELKARGKMNTERAVGSFLSGQINSLLKIIPDHHLDYRTVDA